MHAFAFVLLALAQTNPIEATRHDSLSGTVVDRVGKPVADAELFLSGNTRTTPRDVYLIQGRGRSDAQGRFTVTLNKEFAGQDASDLDLIAVRPGFAPTGSTKQSRSIDSGQPLQIVLDAAAKTRFLVLDPDDKPVADAQLAVQMIASSQLSRIPTELANRLAIRTDAQGRAEAELVPLSSSYSILITSKRFGAQHKVVRQSGNVVLTLRLSPVGHLSVQITDGDARAAKGLRVLGIASAVRNACSGWFEATIDEHGRCEIPALAQGRYVLVGSVPTASPVRLELPTYQSVSAGEQTALTIRTKQRIRIRGLVREKTTGRPVANLRIKFGDFSQFTASGAWSVWTDAHGRYDAFADPGQVIPFVNWPGEFLVSPEVRPDAMMIPSTASEIELPPIELTRTGRVRGIVLDQDGRPMQGALVQVLWHERFPSSTLAASRSLPELSPDGNGMGSTTNTQGEFIIEGLPRDTDLWLMAGAGEACSALLESARADDNVNHRLSISRDHTKALKGRVYDEYGKPIRGAPLRIHSQVRLPDGTAGQRGGRMDLRNDVVTDADGRFETARVLRPYEEYCVRCIVPGEWQGRTGWFAPTTPSFFAIGLSRANPPAEQTALRQAFDAGKAAYARGEYAEAERQQRTVVDEATQRDIKDPSVPVWWLALADACQRQRKYEEAADIFKKVIAMREKMFDPEHPDIPAAMLGLADVYDSQGRFTESEPVLHKAMTLIEKIHGVDSPYFAWGLILLGIHHERLGEFAEAIPKLQRSLIIRDAAWGPNHPEIVFSLTALARSHMGLGEFAEAERDFRRALTISEASAGANHLWVTEILDPYARLLRITGRQPEARALEDRAKAIRELPQTTPK